jgi:hypothetical protein
MYEAVAGVGRGLWPSPLVIYAKVASTTEVVLSGPDSAELYAPGVIFREDAFDPVARIRRGRFYLSNASSVSTWQVSPHPAAPEDDRRVNRIGLLSLELVAFQPYRISEVLKTVKDGHPLIVLGDRVNFTPWTVVSLELSVSSEEIVTLRSRATLGALPDLLLEKIPAAGIEKLRSAIGTLSEDLHRAGPESVVDRCRNAIAWILSIYLQSPAATQTPPPVATPNSPTLSEHKGA